MYEKEIKENLTYVGQADPDVWVILVDGKMIKTTSKNKDFFTTKGAAANSLRREIDQILSKAVVYGSSTQNWQAKRIAVTTWFRDEYKQWKNLHVQIVKFKDMGKTQEDWAKEAKKRKTEEKQRKEEERKRQAAGRWYNILEE